ncbi:MAG: hypothetical protein Q7R47_03680 [Candidatus Diapherotrites archaeon]|nr:hypothetical protein [Candidatus Diapherotrites archaeon]
MARKLKIDLTKRGHHLRVLEALPEYVAHRNQINPLTHVFGGEKDAWGHELRKSVPQATVIELHTSLDHNIFGNAGHHRKTRQWQAIHNPQIDLQPIGQIQLMTAGPNWFVLETPARYVADLSTHKAVLAGSKRANYLAPNVIRKIGHLINTVVNTEQGAYRTPKREPHKYRIPWHPYRTTGQPVNPKRRPRPRAANPRG